jgi:hypothetical protein
MSMLFADSLGQSEKGSIDHRTPAKNVSLGATINRVALIERILSTRQQRLECVSKPTTVIPSLDD